MLYYDGQEKASLEEQVAINKYDIEQLKERVDTIDPDTSDTYLHEVVITNTDLNFTMGLFYRSKRSTAYTDFDEFVEDETKIFEKLCDDGSTLHVVEDVVITDSSVGGVYYIDLAGTIRDMLFPTTDIVDMTFADFFL